MRLKQYLNEWKIIKGYAGREIVRAFGESNIIIWYYMIIPIKKGLIWTASDGTTYLNDKKLGVINYPIEKITHKKQLADFYTKLEFGKLISGDLRNDVEEMNEMNVRGRIVGNEIHIYRYEQQRGIFDKKKYDKMVEKAIDAIYNYIPEEET